MGLKWMSGAGLRAAVVGVSTLLVVSVLAGCAPKPAVYTPVPQVSATPVFASDEEALAAAVEAYAKYLKVSDDILHGGGKDTSLASTVMTGDLLKSSLQGFAEAASERLRTTGSTKFDSETLQYFDSRSNGKSIVTMYVCDDLSDVQIIDDQQNVVTPSNRQPRSLILVTFDLVPNSVDLIVSGSELWSNDPC